MTNRITKLTTTPIDKSNSVHLKYHRVLQVTVHMTKAHTKVKTMRSKKNKKTELLMMAAGKTVFILIGTLLGLNPKTPFLASMTLLL